MVLARGVLHVLSVGNNVHMLHVSLCPCLREMFVCVSPASSSSPSGAPASLLPLSSLGCDCFQLTPPLLWQPENSLEKGQLATFSLGLPGSTLQRCMEWGRPLLAMRTTNGPHNWGFLFPIQIAPETSGLVNKEP